MILTPEQAAAGARAMFDQLCTEAHMPEDEIERSWLLSGDRYVRYFAAGVTTLPDHTAELVEALGVFLDDPAIQVSLGGNPVYADQRLGFAREVYDNARAQTEGGVT
jgi:hypothetical protein